MLIGLAIGRLSIDTKKNALRLVLGGLAVAALAKSLSALLLALAGGPDRLAAHTEGLTLVSQDMPTQLAVGLYGTTPTTDAGWLLVTAPHSSTTFDLLHTGGAAVTVLGLCLLLVRQVGRRAVLPLVAVGSMTLTLYTVHVASLWTDGPLLGQDAAHLYVGQVGAAIVLASLWRSHIGRGPLEALGAVLDRWARVGFLTAAPIARREPASPEAPDPLRM